MKTMYKPMVIFMVACAAGACDFLDRTPFTQIATDEYFTEELHFKHATIGAYEAITTNVVGGAQTSSVSAGHIIAGFRS